MDFKTSITTCLKEKYCTFTGRASRSEYWYFFLLNFLVQLVLTIVLAPMLAGSIMLVYSLAVIVPGIAVAIRRMHDVDKSGWWLLLTLVPLANFYIIYLVIIKGTEGENRFGPAVV